jgi:hypothetical protein
MSEEKLHKLETSFEVMKNEMKNLGTGQEEIKQSLKEFKLEMKESLDEIKGMFEKKADKWVEKAFWIVVTATTVAFITAIFKLL